MRTRILNKSFLIPALAVALTGFAANAQYAPNDGQYCREFTAPIRIAGRVQQGYGTSCQQPDGSWQVVQQPTVQGYNNQPPVGYQQPVAPIAYPPTYVEYAPYPYYGYGYRPYYRPHYSPISLSFSWSNWGHGGGHWHH